MDQGQWPGSLPSFKSYRARSITSITGPLAFGTRLSKTNLNKDRLENVAPGETVTLAEMPGPGEITHIWFTVHSQEDYWPRKVMLRIYWDGQERPSVETPLCDFFATPWIRFDEGGTQGPLVRVNSLPVVVNPNRSMNCFWEMPGSIRR